MIYYEVQNLYEEHYSKELLIDKLVAAKYNYFGILHDKDIFPTGEPKKNHFHLIIGVNYDSKVAKKNISLYFNDNSLIFKPIRNLQKYCRYLTHKDNLEKYQYNDNDVFTSDKSLYFELIEIQITTSKTDLLLNDFVEWVRSESFSMDERVIFNWFKDRNKLDYYLKNMSRIYSMINIIIFGRSVVFKDDPKYKKN